MSRLIFDLRYASRMFRRSPVSTLVGVLALGLGIGANIAVFSLVYGLLLRPVAFRDSDSLTLVWETVPDGGERSAVSPANFNDWERQNHVFEHMAAYRTWEASITNDGEPEPIDACQVSQDFFRALKVTAELGRTFLPEEHAAGLNQVVVLSHGLWQRIFAGDPNVVGKAIELGERPHTIVGVLPPDMDWPIANEVWSPLVLQDDQRQDRRERSLEVMGRLKQGIPLSQAQAEMETIGHRLAQQYPASDEGWGAKLARLPGVDEEVTRPFLLTLMAAAAFVLLVACANVASLQLARAIRRQKEMALRTALGAGRLQLMRQVLTESVVLSGLSAALAVGIAVLGVHLIKADLPAAQARYVPGFSRLHVGATELGFALTAAMFTAFVSGLAPIARMSTLDLQTTLQDAGRGSTAGLRSLRLHSVLVVGQLALAVILMAGTGSMVSGFSRLRDSQRQGFDSKNLLTLRITVPLSRYSSAQQRATVYTRILDKLATLPGMRTAAAVSLLPATNSMQNQAFSMEESLNSARRAKNFADVESASAGYFQTMGIRVVEGREFTWQDGEHTPPVAIISKGLASRFWPGQDAIGHHIKLGVRESGTAWLTIVGIVGDVRQFMFDPKPPDKIYLPYAQSPDPSMSLLIRTVRDPAQLVGSVRAALTTIDPKLPISDMRSMDELMEEEAAGVSIATELVASFGFVALTLSAIGIYSLMAYSNSRRTQEMGIRMALGAERWDLVWMVLRQGLRLGAAGLAIGIVGAIGLTRLLAGFLYGAVPAGAGNLVITSAVLAAAVLAASYVPASRASTVDPAITLRTE